MKKPVASEMPRSAPSYTIGAREEPCQGGHDAIGPSRRNSAIDVIGPERTVRLVSMLQCGSRQADTPLAAGGLEVLSPVPPHDNKLYPSEWRMTPISRALSPSQSSVRLWKENDHGAKRDRHPAFLTNQIEVPRLQGPPDRKLQTGLRVVDRPPEILARAVLPSRSHKGCRGSARRSSRWSLS